MKMQSLYAWLIRLHPRSFRDRFESEMLWLYEKTAAERGGLRLVADGLVSLIRQRMLRRKPRQKPAEGLASSAIRRTGWLTALTPEAHLLILCIPWVMWLALGVDTDSSVPYFNETQIVKYAALIVFECGWFLTYRRRLLRSPLKAPLALAHLSYRAQLEDSLKTISWMGVPPLSPLRRLRATGVMVASLLAANQITTALGYTHSYSFLTVSALTLHLWLCSQLSSYAAETLKREIDQISAS